MNTHPDSPGSLIIGQDKDNTASGFSPVFDTEFFRRVQDEAAPLPAQAKPNPFPTEVFPLPVQQIITATNESLSFPIDFIGAGLLYAASVAIGNTHRAEVKTGWTDGAVLYVALVGKPGTNKTHPLQFALKPIFTYDKAAYREYEQQRSEYEKALNLFRNNKKKPAGEPEPQKPVLQQILLRDTTPEALAITHKYNPRGIALYSDELAGWFKNFNRYNKGSEMEFWLSAWSGTQIAINRKSSEPIQINQPFISVGGTIQNGVLNELAKDSRTENGFCDRILFAFPDNLQKEPWNPGQLSQEIIHNWEQIVSRLLGIELAYDNTFSPVPELMLFSPEAWQMLSNWQRDNTTECNLADNEAVGGIYAKLEIYAIRLALILELMFWACGQGSRQTIGAKSVQGALRLVEYFKNSAIKVYGIISNTNPEEQLPASKRNLLRSLPDTFTTEAALEIAQALGIPERTLKRFLKDGRFFNWMSRGEYEKL